MVVQKPVRKTSVLIQKPILIGGFVTRPLEPNP